MLKAIAPSVDNKARAAPREGGKLFKAYQPDTDGTHEHVFARFMDNFTHPAVPTPTPVDHTRETPREKDLENDLTR